MAQLDFPSIDQLCRKKISRQGIWNERYKIYLQSDKQKGPIYTQTVETNDCSEQIKTSVCLLLETWKLSHTILFALKQLVVYSGCNINANILFSEETKTITCISNTTVTKINGWGYTHDRRANKNPYPHDRRADKDSYPHDRNVTNDLCSLIKLCSAFIMVNFST